MEGLKLCRDCRWRERNPFIMSHLQECRAPAVVAHQLMINPAGDGFVTAEVARGYGPCYKEGRFWERADERLEVWLTLLAILLMAVIAAFFWRSL